MTNATKTYRQFLSAPDAFDRAVALGDHDLADQFAIVADRKVREFEGLTVKGFWE